MTEQNSPAPDLVLIVEDDDGICQVLCEMLDDVGYDCICAKTDKAAYDALREKRSIAALIADINLGPGTTGFDVARFARQVISDLPVIYLSGAASPRSYAAFGVPGSVWMEKPFNPQALIAKVQEVIALRGDFIQ